MRAHHFTVGTAAALLFAATVQAQSLADLARKEEERRKGVPESAKVYTNKDLNAVPGPSAPPPPAAAAPTKSAVDAAKDAAKEKDATGDKGSVNALSTDFVNRDDPAQRAAIERDRQKALAELTRLKQAVVDGKKAIATLEEDARRAGVPPGWLR